MFGHGFGSKFPRHYFKLWNLVKPQRKDPRVVSWCARDSGPRRAVPAAGQEPASGVHTQPAPLLADQRRHRRKKKSPTSCSLLYLPATFSFVLVMDLLPLSCASSMDGSRGLWWLDAWIRQRAVLLLAWRGTVGCAWDMGGHGSPASRSSGFLVRRWLALMVLG